MDDGQLRNVGDAGIGVVRYLYAAGAAVAELVAGDDPDDTPETGNSGQRLPELARSMYSVSPSTTATSSIARRSIVAAS